MEQVDAGGVEDNCLSSTLGAAAMRCRGGYRWATFTPRASSAACTIARMHRGLLRRACSVPGAHLLAQESGNELPFELFPLYRRQAVSMVRSRVSVGFHKMRAGTFKGSISMHRAGDANATSRGQEHFKYLRHAGCEGREGCEGVGGHA